MEKLYRKKANGRYVEDSYGFNEDLSDGIWLVQTKPHSRSVSSLLWKVGELKRPADIVTHASLQALESQLAQYLVKLSDESSEEYKEAKEICGGYMKAPPVYNIPASDLVTLFLRKMAIELEQGTIPPSLYRVVLDFRTDSKIYLEPGYIDKVDILNKFIEYLEANNYKLVKQ